MPQRRLTLAPVALALVTALCAASTGSAHAADECVAKPNAPAPQGEHWYYRTDRATNRQCWHLGPQGTSVKKSATEASKQPASDSLPAMPPRAQGSTATASTVAPAATAAEANVPAPMTPLPWPEAANLPDAPPSFEPTPALAASSRSADVIGPAPALASNPAQEPQSPTNARSSLAAAPAQAAGDADHTVAVLIIVLATLAAFAIASAVFPAARRTRRRETSDRQSFELPRQLTLNTPFPRTRTSLKWNSEPVARHIPPTFKSLDQKQKLARALQHLLNEMQTKQYAPQHGPSIDAIELARTSTRSGHMSASSS